MHTCIVTTAHPVDDVRVYSKFARSLLDAGHDLTWVGPEVGFYEGAHFRDPRIAYRLLKAGGGRWNRVRQRKELVRLAASVPGVDWWYTPDPDSAGLILKLSGLNGGRTVFDIHEVFHGAPLQRHTFGRHVAPASALLRQYVSSACRRMDLVIGVNQSVLGHYIEDSTKSMVLPNCAPTWFAQEVPPALEDDGRLTISHGKIIGSNGTPVVVEALKLLEQAEDRVRVLMYDTSDSVAAYSAELRAQIEGEDFESSIAIRKPVSHEAMRSEMQACQLGLIAYGLNLGVESLPNRLFEYMASGLAILAPSYSSEIASILEANAIGLTADFESAQDVADAMSWFADNRDDCLEMGERAQHAFMSKYRWEAAAVRLFERLEVPHL